MGSDREWRCRKCSRLLGITEGDRLHVRFSRGHEYLVGLPTTCVCRSCGALNELRLPRSATEEANRPKP